MKKTTNKVVTNVKVAAKNTITNKGKSKAKTANKPAVKKPAKRGK